MKKTSNSSDEPRNYELKSDAVDALANATQGRAPTYSKKELEQYRSRSGLRIPEAGKILLLKAWFAGAVCFFFLWGLGTYLTSTLDLLFVTAIALGVVTDLLTNNAIRFFEKNPGDNTCWMMFPKKSVTSFFLNILYAFGIVFCVYMLYVLINYGITRATGAADTVPLGVEPILFGLFCMGFDVLFLGAKRLLQGVFCRAGSASGEK